VGEAQGTHGAFRTPMYPRLQVQLVLFLDWAGENELLVHGAICPPPRQ